MPPARRGTAGTPRRRHRGTAASYYPALTQRIRALAGQGLGNVDLRRESFELDPLSIPGDWGSAEGEKLFLQSVERIPGAVSALLGVDCAYRFRWVPHHIAHAASAYYPCGDDKAAAMVVDGIGESATALLGGGHGTTLKRTGDLSYPNSIGFVWEN